MFLLSNFLTVQRFGTQIPNVNLSTGIIGAICVALLTLGVVSLRSKSPSTLVMVRTDDGTVSSIFRTDYRTIQLRANRVQLPARAIPQMPRFGHHRKLKYFVGIAVVAAIASSYLGTGLAMGFTLQEIVVAGSSPLMVVSSQSMQPALNYGDLILMRGEPASSVAIGDVIAFNVPSPYDKVAASPTVHRVIGKWTENGEIYFTTKGDGNAKADAWVVSAENVIGVYTQSKIPYVGSLVIFLKSPLGITSLALVFALVFLLGYFRKMRVKKNDR